VKSGAVLDRDQVIQAVLAREHSMSTGMQDGIAIPHAKTDGVTRLCTAIGIKKGGIDFDSLDKIPSKIFIMVVSPKKAAGPHLQFLAFISGILKSPGIIERMLNAERPVEVKNIVNECSSLSTNK
jgi:mannitol/fructose-specific phosphotransferase system IIA component (Ntr-type)